MSKDSSKDSSIKDFAVPVVALVDKDGNVAHVSTAIELNNLVFGSGYKLRDHDNVAEATDFLAGRRETAASEPVPSSSNPPPQA